MRYPNPNRGGESPEHRQLKIKCANVAQALGLVMLYESQNIDVLCVDPKTGITIAIEVELGRNARDVTNNIRNDLQLGCTFVLAVAPNSTHAAAIRRCYDRRLDTKSRKYCDCCSIDDLHDTLTSLLHNLGCRPHVGSGTTTNPPNTGGQTMSMHTTNTDHAYPEDTKHIRFVNAASGDYNDVHVPPATTVQDVRDMLDLDRSWDLTLGQGHGYLSNATDLHDLGPDGLQVYITRQPEFGETTNG